MQDSLIILFTTFIATGLSAMSGGGASMINLPVFMGLGIPFALASATQKLSSTFWLLPSAYNYLKDRKVDWKFLFLFSLVGLLGAYLGLLVVLELDQRIAEILVGALILLLVFYTFIKKDLGLQEKTVHSRLRQFMAYPFAILMGFYESIFGAGNGIIFTIVSFHTKGFDFTDALGSYFAVAFLWVFFATAYLIAMGYYDVNVMIPAVIGSVLGGFIGSRYAKYKGNRFIKNAFMIIGGILGVKLLLGW